MTIRQINQVLDEGISLKLITQAYSELSAIKLKRIRSGIEANRAFFTELAHVFRTVKRVAGKKRRLSEILDRLVAKNGKSVALLLTSNYRFYGDINSMVIQQFMLGAPKFNTDRIVVGKMGVEFLHAARYPHPFKPVIFSSDLPAENELQALIDEVKNYQQVLVFHSRFKSILAQLPTVTDVTQTAASSLPPQPDAPDNLNLMMAEGLELINPFKPGVDESEEPLDFILEPEIDKMLQFFDSQITTLLVETAFLEAELSRTASRMVAMDGAESNANQFIRAQKRLLSSTLKSQANTRLLETFGSFMIWKRNYER